MKRVTQILLLSAIAVLAHTACRGTGEPGPFDYPYNRGRVLIHLSPRTSTLLSFQGDYLQIFYYDRSLDRLLPPGYPRRVSAEFDDSVGTTQHIELYDDGQHLDRDEGDGIFANYAVGTLADLTKRTDLDEFLIDTELDTLSVRVHFVTLGFKPAPISHILVPAEGPLSQQQAEATLMVGASIDSGALFIVGHNSQISFLSNRPFWQHSLGPNASGGVLTIPFAPPVVNGERYCVGLWTVVAPAWFSSVYTLDLMAMVADSNLGFSSPFDVMQNYPNPFNTITTITWRQDALGPISLRIFDVAGRLIRTLLPQTVCTPGMHYLMWDGCDEAGVTVASGLYFLVGQSTAAQRAMRVVVLR
jgi:hypothetical protein